MKINFSAQVRFGNFSDESKIRGIYDGFIQPDKKIINVDRFEKSPNILNLALNLLEQIEFATEDIKRVKRYGARPVFRSGKEAVEFAKVHQIPIIFGKVAQPDVHAQWDNSQKTIVINEMYKNTQNPADLYAISSAILHELSHAKDDDGISSIQEEIDCLAMNAMAFNVYQKRNPELFKGANSPIIKDGVALYTRLFMGDNKAALEERVRMKYGNLPAGSPNHEPQKLALEIAKKVDDLA